MKEIGKVTKIYGKSADVKVDKKDECSKCGMCLFSNNANYTTFHSLNKVNAKVGDSVLIETKESGKLLSTFFVFGIPLILIGLAVIIGLVILKNDLLVLAFAVGFLLIWFLFLGLIDKKLKTKSSFETVIVQIISGVGEENNEGNNRN